jgi:hypothetical protein
VYRSFSVTYLTNSNDLSLDSFDFEETKGLGIVGKVGKDILNDGKDILYINKFF